MLKKIKKMQKKHKKKKILEQRAKAQAISKNKKKSSARPNISSAEMKKMAETKTEADLKRNPSQKMEEEVFAAKKTMAKAAAVKATTKATTKTTTKTSSKSSSKTSAKGYGERIKKHHRDALKKGVVIAAAAVGLLAALAFFVEKGSYHNYRILQTSEQEDIISTKYIEMDGKILRYSPEGAAFVDSKLQTHWSELYDMENPVADVCGDAAVIADCDGTTMKIFDKNGLTGSINTSYSIVKAHVSASGLVAAILDAGDETWINYYSYDGSLIAENQTRIEDPGYPMDVTVSTDGNVMMMAYQFVDGGETTSYVAFYNFGDVGQNEEDRIVSGYTYVGVVIPQVECLSGNRYVALRDDGFTIYEGKQIPKESTTVKVEEEIVSIFYDDETIGLVFKNGNKEKPYTMKVYSASGKLQFEKDFNIPYTTIKMSGEYIIMYNSSQMCVLNNNGVEKYSGTIDGTIKNFFKLGWNRYLLVLDTGINVVKFS